MTERETVSYTEAELRARAKEREGRTYKGLTYLQYIAKYARDPLVSDQTINAVEAWQKFDEEERRRAERGVVRDREDAVLLEIVATVLPRAPHDTLYDMVYHMHSYTLHRNNKLYRITVEEVEDE
jgi:hypothetical protein